MGLKFTPKLFLLIIETYPFGLSNSIILLEHTFLYFMALRTFRHLSSKNNILSEIRANLEKNQQARTELYAMLDKPYYVEPIKYKVDAASADDEDDH